MQRLILLLCCLQYSLATIIRGRVLLDGDETKTFALPTGSTLTVMLQDTSMADALAQTLSEIRVPNVASLPHNFQMNVSNNLPPALRYSITARISNGNNLLFINDQVISVNFENNKLITIDVPVRNLQKETIDDDKVVSWPEMLGKPGSFAVEYIKKQSGLTNVFTIYERSPMTFDYRTDRVRVVVNVEGIVIRIPYIG